MFGFLFEGVQHVDDSGETDGVDGAVRISLEVVHDLEHAGTAKSLEWFRIARLEADLRIPKRATDAPPDVLREAPQLLLAACDPTYGLGLNIVSGRQRHSPSHSMPVQV